MIVSGRITDKEFGTPIPNVNVFVASSINVGQLLPTFQNGTATDQNGNFTLPYGIEPSVKVTFSHVTYGTTVLTAQEIANMKGNIQLSEFTNSLDEVVITNEPVKKPFSWRTFGLFAGAGVLLYALSTMDSNKPLKVKL